MIMKNSQAEKIYEKLLLLQVNDDFMIDALALRKKCKDLSEIFYVDGEDILFSYDDTPEFENDLKELMDKYNLPNIFHFPLKTFIVNSFLLKPEYYSEIAPRLIPAIEEPIFYTSEETGEDAVHFPKNWGDEQFVAIEIFPETTINDISSNWDKIAEKRDFLYGIKRDKSERFVKSKNIERDLLIYKLRKEGKKYSEIKDIINGDIRFIDKKIEYQEVSKIIKRLKTKAEKKVPPKKS